MAKIEAGVVRPRQGSNVCKIPFVPNFKMTEEKKKGD